VRLGGVADAACPAPPGDLPLKARDGPEDDAYRLLATYDDAGLSRVLAVLYASRPWLSPASIEQEASMPPFATSSKDVAMAAAESTMEAVTKPIALDCAGAGEFTVVIKAEDSDGIVGEPTMASSWQKVPRELLHMKTSAIEQAVKASIHATTEESPAIMQFSSSIYYCKEDERVMRLEVVRLGNRCCECSVHYQTEDSSAAAGQKYVASSGVLHFFHDELSKDIEIQLLDDKQWDATLEFVVKLSNPEGASLGRYLHQCRVRILDDDAFPTNRFRDLCEQRRFDDIPKMALLWEYCKMNIRRRDVRARVIVHLLVDLMDNIVKIIPYALQLYLVDSVLADTEAPLQTQTLRLAVVGMLLFLPHLALFLFDMFRTEMRLAGHCRELLQLNIVRKFLNYDSTTRALLKESDVILTISHDCPDVVEKGLFSSMELLKEATLLVMLFVYQVAACSQTEEDMGSLYTAAVPALLLPVCLSLFLRVRLNKTVTAHSLLNHELENLAGLIEEIVSNFRLISGFNCRPKMLAQTQDMLRTYNAAGVETRRVDLVNQYFGPLLMKLFIGAFIVSAGRMHLEGKMTLGQFVTNLAVLHQMSESWNAIHKDLLVVEVALPSLVSIVAYLNMPLDLEQRQQLNLYRREANCREREKVLGVIDAMAAHLGGISKTALYSMDFVPLRLKQVSFAYGLGVHRCAGYPPTPKSGGSPKHCFSRQASGTDEDLGPESFGSWSLDMQQGSLVAIVGRHGMGKTTLLKLLGGVLLPVNGDFFSPPHLRAFYIPQEPLFFRASLFDNLIFGLQGGDEEDASMQRVLAICRRLGVCDRILSLIEDKSVGDWRNVLSMTERVQIHLGRALIANPEILILEKPSLAFDNKQAVDILRTLREFVDNRGLEIDSDSINSSGSTALTSVKIRRPRTCVFTASRMAGCTVADEIYEVGMDFVRRIEHADVTENMLR